ncbi:hypothetical protein F2Q68_00021351 [Brassica cretica]|uniref:Uncharacterized protein n=1 Tax=Brassica cretica TaxID=69181 RepID=A0A8S9G3R8_BRACR|nr:hypothetical protein F2Q68_00021351 [Brassica cretica]
MSTLFFCVGGGELGDSGLVSLLLLFEEPLVFRLDFGVAGSSSSSSEKWEKKKAATDYEARLREVMANIDLLKEIMHNNLLASDDLSRLRTKEITEDLPEDFFAKVPFTVNDTGDEMKCAGGQFEDGEFDIEE